MSWMNDDGLYIKFGKEEADTVPGGTHRMVGDLNELSVNIPYTELSVDANAHIVGSTANPGSRGIIIPNGVRLEKLVFVVKTAFTSSGTIGSATFVSGTYNASDRTTVIDADGLTTASATGTALGLATVGTVTEVKVGSTGAGALLGTTLAANSILVAANTLHASHPYTAGELVMRVYYTVP